MKINGNAIKQGNVIEHKGHYGSSQNFTCKTRKEKCAELFNRLAELKKL